MKTILITGAAGFLGRHIAREFAQAGCKVVGVDVVAAENSGLGPGVEYARLTLPSPSFTELIRRTQPAALIHCAGRASVASSLSDPAADFRDGTVLTFEVLDALRTAAPRCRFVLLSSAAVYGNPVSLPVTEDHACAPLSPYGYHKRQSELLCEEFARLFAIPTTVVRIFSAYGPGLRRQVVWEVCRQALTESELRLHGTGGESRDFIHAADVARALRQIVESGPCTGEICNLASGTETTIAELADCILRQLGRAIPIRFDGAQTPGDPLHWRAEISRVRALGFEPRVTLEKGLESIAAWCAAEVAL
ncbi:MAG: NAD-dependent epimerase/dehydratase family protein [Chthoniobacteraceae bacterium]